MFSYFFQYSLKFFIFSSKKKEIMEMLSGVLTTEFLIRDFMLNLDPSMITDCNALAQEKLGLNVLV